MVHHSKFLYSALVVSAMAVGANAQVTTSAISGKVLDETKAPVQGKIKSDQRTQTFALLTAISIIGEEQKVNGFSGFEHQPPSFRGKPGILCGRPGKKDCKQRENRV